MGDVRGFLKVKRQESKCRPVAARTKDYRDVVLRRCDDISKEQASRCMDCGTPFCHWACPIANYIPEWNDALYNGLWLKAFLLLDANNNFPEFTGRLCPAPCEYACVLGINDDPVTIKENEATIIEHAAGAGYLKANVPEKRTGKKIAIIGSGPAGLAAASQLNKAGHKVVVYEKDKKVGGILRYGIPDFKLEKWIIDRRIAILKKEGIEFVTGREIGKKNTLSGLKKEYDAICLAIGSRVPRDLAIEGRSLQGIYFAMDYLTQSNRRVGKEAKKREARIDAKHKRVVVIGGGDTGADCVGTAHRQGAASVIQIEVMPQPPQCRPKDYPWPKYPLLLKQTSSHEEGGARQWSILTKRFIGEEGHVKKLACVKIEFTKTGPTSCPIMKEIAGSEFEIDTDMVVLAIGFTGPERRGLLSELGVALDERGNIKTDTRYLTSVEGVFAAGDARRGQSLIVWAIAEGRRAAHAIDTYLMGNSVLPIV